MTEFRPPGAGFPADPPGTWVVPDHPAPVYADPGCIDPGYPYQAYPYAAAPYAAPDYSTYPSPGRAWPGGPPAPGALTVAAMLGLVAAGVLVLSGLLLLVSASAVQALADSIDSSDHGLGSELFLDGLGNLVAAGFLVAGAVLLRRGKSRGRPLVAIGSVITTAFSVVWMSQHSAGLVVIGAVFLATPALLATGLAYTRPVTDWLRRPRPPAPALPTPYPPIAH